jgi:hypothetical protein
MLLRGKDKQFFEHSRKKKAKDESRSFAGFAFLRTFAPNFQFCNITLLSDEETVYRNLRLPDERGRLGGGGLGDADGGL